MRFATFRITLLLAIGLCAMASPLAARELTVERFDAVYRVLPSGDVEVTETLQLRFEGEWNGVLRDIVLRQRDAYGRRVRVGLDHVVVTDAANRTLEVERESADGGARRLRIYVPDARDATRTVVIRYTLSNSLRFFDAESDEGELDELYWQITGTRWEAPIQRVSARIELPEGLEPTQVAAYSGESESTSVGSATVRQSGNAVVVEAGPLAAGEGLTVGVGWPAGTITRPALAAPPAGAAGIAAGFWPLLLPLLTFWFAFRRWLASGKDPERRPITVQYEPPEALTPAELGTLVDHRAEMRDITAILVDLAVRGYVMIEQIEEKRLLGLTSDTQYIFHLRRPRARWDDLAPHERIFLDRFFKGADRVEMKELKNSFYKSLGSIREAIYSELIRRGYYERRPDHVWPWWGVPGLLLVAGGLIAAAVVSETRSLWLHPLGVAAGFGLSGAILFAFGFIMSARTEAGARTMERALGFKEFLGRVEADRFERMIDSPALFERYLPHAMAFGVEERWAEAFDDMYLEPPDWYHGDGGTFRATHLAHNLSTMSQETGSMMQSSPSSSGSGGGGSVGGGGGGGGGGGF